MEMPEASVMVQSKVTLSPGPTVLGEERETADNSAGVTSASVPSTVKLRSESWRAGDLGEMLV